MCQMCEEGKEVQEGYVLLFRQVQEEQVHIRAGLVAHLWLANLAWHYCNVLYSVCEIGFSLFFP
jgi:hypothetical protein